MPLPVMECPYLVDFVPMERIQKLYGDLPSIFAKEIARRQQQIGISITAQPLSAKRDRSHDSILESASKRRDTGESKASSMPPPALPISSPAVQTNFSLPLTNGNSTAMLPPPQSTNSSLSL